MSYILDALRKSEQDRRDQEAPAFTGASVTMGASAQETSHRTILWVFAGVVITVNVLGLAYFLTRSDTQQVEHSVVQAQETKRVEESSRASVPEIKVQETPESQAIPKGNSIPDKYRLPNPKESTVKNDVAVVSLTADEQVINPLDFPEGEVIRPRASVQVARGEAHSSMVSQLDSLQAETIAPKYPVVNMSSQKGEEDSVRAQLLADLTPDAPEIIKPSTSESSTRKGISQSEANRLPVVKDLSAAQRAKVPVIRFSGHLYSSRPASRSVRLGTQKYREGDWVNDALQLMSITEDGVVFDLEGTLFYMSSFEDWGGK
jgi:hypothetical protein